MPRQELQTTINPHGSVESMAPLSQYSPLQLVLQRLCEKLRESDIELLTIDYDGDCEGADFLLQLHDHSGEQIADANLPDWADLSIAENLQKIQPDIIELISDYTRSLNIADWTDNFGGHGVINLRQDGTYEIRHYICHMQSIEAGTHGGNAWRDCPSEPSLSRLH